MLAQSVGRVRGGGGKVEKSSKTMLKTFSKADNERGNRGEEGDNQMVVGRKENLGKKKGVVVSGRCKIRRLEGEQKFREAARTANPRNVTIGGRTQNHRPTSLNLNTVKSGEKEKHPQAPDAPLHQFGGKKMKGDQVTPSSNGPGG